MCLSYVPNEKSQLCGKVLGKYLLFRYLLSRSICYAKLWARQYFIFAVVFPSIFFSHYIQVKKMVKESIRIQIHAVYIRSFFFCRLFVGFILKISPLYIRLSFLDISFHCHPLLSVVNRRLYQEVINLGRGMWKGNAEFFLKLLLTQRPQTANMRNCC